tara:strand:- start:685 stop:786 length:102 start_codon:yes stop_codon:yes gene_type:complete
MKDSFWIGLWPGITKEMIDYMIDTLNKVVKDNL